MVTTVPRGHPEVLLLRGRAEATEVDGVVPEYALAHIRYGGTAGDFARRGQG
ncbi:hypothetical protein GCM10023320_73880 [Pseudonocardia adelaidensis]|uniref:Uncharacterized protein n=2 Tax=Pseudonocardia adelaidensis TaxID=648754 RepID=A0ABP9P1R8_9PSEU